MGVVLAEGIGLSHSLNVKAYINSMQAFTFRQPMGAEANYAEMKENDRGGAGVLVNLRICRIVFKRGGHCRQTLMG